MPRELTLIGQVLGHYHVVSKIGEGGMGAVYRARDEVLHRDVALKVVSKSAGLDQSTSQSLLQEARASSNLSHPNICTIHEVGETDGELYIVMELVEGKSLRSLIGNDGLPVESVLRYGVQIANALGRAHDPRDHTSRSEERECGRFSRWSGQSPRFRPGEARWGRNL